MTREINFKKYSSIGIGPSLHVEVLDELVEIDKSSFILGGGNNILVSPNPPNVVMLGENYNFIYEKNKLLHVGGATPSAKILAYAKKHDIKNFELMQKLPGTLGGMIKMNAGLKEWEIFNSLVAVKIGKNWKKKQDIELGYRHTNIEEVIYEATFEIEKGFDLELLNMFKKLRENQPKHPSAGSCFKNPLSYFAGKLLDEVGLKGYRMGDMAFSKTHANFLVNLGDGTFEDAINLIDLAKKRVFSRHKIQLELEIKIVKS